jgi:zinc-ribbon domain
VTQLAQRGTSQSAAMDALWAASVRDVVAPAQGTPAGTVQPCNSCGLSLSANARFCRRCGTRQGA